MIRSLTAVFLGTTLAPAPALAACDGVHVITQPARPRQGALFRVLIQGVAANTTLSGSAAGEPLHFTTVAGEKEALAAASIDGPPLIRVTVMCTVAGRTDSTTARVALARANYPLERLQVAPQFSAPPDPALEARLRREAALAADVGRRSHETPQLWTGPFHAPRDSRVTSTFGRAREFNGSVTSRHMGMDYAGAVGATVRAAESRCRASGGIVLPRRQRCIRRPWSGTCHGVSSSERTRRCGG